MWTHVFRIDDVGERTCISLRPDATTRKCTETGFYEDDPNTFAPELYHSTCPP